MSKRKVFLLALLEGLTVIILEVLAKNILCPYFGNTISIWTICIGNTFLFVSIGYAFSNRILRKNNPELFLKKAWLLIAASILLIPLMSFLLVQPLIHFSLTVGAVISHTLIFGFPLVLLGTINPILIQLISSESNSGYNSAKVFFVSTLGAILGTIILIVNYAIVIEINQMILFLAILIYLSVFYVSVTTFRNHIFASLFLFQFIFFNSSLNFNLHSSSIVYHSNDLYGDLKVYDFFDTEIKYTRRSLSVNNIPQTSISNNPYIFSNWNYVHRISLFSSLKFGKKGLLIGFGGGSIASELQKMNLTLDIIDIDKRMFDVAEKFFYFDKNKVHFDNQDARYFLNRNKVKYDLVVFDVLNGESQPNNVFTKESFNCLKNSLKPDGIVIIEFQEVENEKSKAVRAIINTLLDENYFVYLSQMGEGVLDYVIIASKSTIDLSKLNPQHFTFNSRLNPWLKEFVASPALKIRDYYPDIPILTDDKPILDKYCEKTRLEWRKNYINSLY